MLGDHRESVESILEAAKRELQEETGAIDFTIKSVCAHSVKGKTRVNVNLDDESFGMLFVAEIKSFEKELHSEIEKILISDRLVQSWTYLLIQPKLLEEAKNRGYDSVLDHCAVAGLIKESVKDKQAVFLKLEKR